MASSNSPHSAWRGSFHVVKGGIELVHIKNTIQELESLCTPALSRQGLGNLKDGIPKRSIERHVHRPVQSPFHQNRSFLEAP